MNPEKVRQLSEELKRAWREVQESASKCFGFWAVQGTLSGLVEMENGKPKYVDFPTEIVKAQKYAKKAQQHIVKEVKKGVEACNRYMSEAPHPNVLVASGFFIKALQICKEQDGCGGLDCCPLLKYTERITLNI